MLFFDKRAPPTDGKPNTKALWIYDLRTNVHFTLKKNPLDAKDLRDFVACYRVGQMGQRKETERFRRFEVDELLARDKLNLDIFWLQATTASTTSTVAHARRSRRRSWRTCRRRWRPSRPWPTNWRPASRRLESRARLAVEFQEVVHGRDAAHGRLAVECGVWPMPV